MHPSIHGSPLYGRNVCIGIILYRLPSKNGIYCLDTFQGCIGSRLIIKLLFPKKGGRHVSSAWASSFGGFFRLFQWILLGKNSLTSTYQFRFLGMAHIKRVRMHDWHPYRPAGHGQKLAAFEKAAWVPLRRLSLLHYFFKSINEWYWWKLNNLMMKSFMETFLVFADSPLVLLAYSNV